MRCGGGGINDDADFEAADLADLGAAGDLLLAAVPALGGGAIAAAAAVAKADALLPPLPLAPDARMPVGAAWYRWLRHSAACGAVTAAARRCAGARRANEISMARQCGLRSEERIHENV